ncbi:hypothetical protein F2P79_012135 [Pimephales promelas]|nr:hypothetical protein F2P79_012135 [Pimephales promelas]
MIFRHKHGVRAAELTGRSDTKTMAKMRIIKGNFWSIMTSLQALTGVKYDMRAGITVTSGECGKHVLPSSNRDSMHI